MKLQSISIKNYRSIESATIELSEVEGSCTYTLIGINESGKSSFLKAIALKDGLESVTNQDFYGLNKPISIEYDYILFDEELNTVAQKIIEGGISEDSINKFPIQKITLSVEVDSADPSSIKKTIAVNLAEKDSKKSNNTEEKDTIKKYIEDNLSPLIFELSHKIIFWKSEQKFLITDPINLEEFLKDPETISVPLINCFNLSGLSDLNNEIGKIRGNPAEVKNLQAKLSDKVTEHIKRVWPGHPIRIEFQIDNMSLSFLIEDEGVKYNAKVTSQRSDGFRQFISFLLTVSAQNISGKLSNSILLLDEPETHLHPQGQENLRDELIKITYGTSNNICIFASHSNYMIDKKHLNRCFRLSKKDNKSTIINPIDGQLSSYSEVNYLVFDVPTSDYHNELYGFLEENSKAKLNSLPKEKIWKNEKLDKDEDVSLPTYIRHSIHHPENTKNVPFSQEDLKKSIEVLRTIKYGK